MPARYHSEAEESDSAEAYDADSNPRMESIDKLIEIGLGDYLPLPQLVVVGDQSSGKSSVLEGLTNLPFPRDSKLCTRFATQIVFRRAPTVRVQVSILPAANASDEERGRVRQFGMTADGEFTHAIFADMLAKASEAMGITSGEPSGSAFSEHVFRVEVHGPTQSHFSVVDIPGLFRVPTEGLTTRADKEIVRAMVSRFIKNPRSVILAVIPANVDIATQEILDLSKEADPSGERTLGVVTKPDLVDKGAESDLIDLVKGKRQTLRLGYCVIRNRGQHQFNLTVEERHANERMFFRTPPFDQLPDERTGIASLRRLLEEVLYDITQNSYHDVRQELLQQLQDVEQEVESLGLIRETTSEQREFLSHKVVGFEDYVRRAVDADYGSDELFKNEAMRLATRIVDLNDELSQHIEIVNSNIIADDTSDSKNEDNDSDTSGADDGTKMKKNIFQPESAVWKIDVHKIDPSLCDILPKVKYPDVPDDIGTVEWISRTHRLTRGFELGGPSSNLVRVLFNQLSSLWEPYALLYIRSLISLIHTFIHSLLVHVCPEADTRKRIWSEMRENLMAKYKNSIEHLQLLIAAERNHMITTNSQYQKAVSKFRLDKFGSVTTTSETHGEEVDALSRLVQKLSSARCTDAARSNGAEPNQEETYKQFSIEDIHDILRAYVQVSSRRFVDAICLQVTDHLLVSCPKSPLRLFSTPWVCRLTGEQLRMLAAEPESKIRKRRELKIRMEKLREGRNALV